MIPWGRIETTADRVLIVGAGPSLAAVDGNQIVRAAEAGVRIIAVNAALLALRCAQDWFTLDFDARNRAFLPCLWGGTRAIAAVPDDFGPGANLPIHRCDIPPGVLYLHRIAGDGPLRAKFGLCDDAGAVHTGNSVWGALGVAWHMKAARRVAFLGLDGSAEPGFPGGHQPRGLEHLPELFASALPQLATRGVEVRNGSPQSLVTCFPRAPASEVLDWIACR